MLSPEESTTTITETPPVVEVSTTTTTEPTTVETTPPVVGSPEISILAENITGTVKWFNNNAGYGFITVCQGEYVGKDIFVHYSSICVLNSQYKYLVQGEYVDFTLIKSDNHNHQYQATNVRGVKGGPIMCETRKSFHSHKNDSQNTRYNAPSSSSRPRRVYREDSSPSRRPVEERPRRSDDRGDYYESRTNRRRIEDTRDNDNREVRSEPRVRRTAPSPEDDRDGFVKVERKRTHPHPSKQGSGRM
jgi:CspA family cold shock protein